MCESLLLIEPFVARLLDNNKSAQLYEGLLIRPSDVELLVVVQSKKGNLLLRPFAAGEMNMSSGKKGCCRLDPFLLDY